MLCVQICSSSRDSLLIDAVGTFLCNALNQLPIILIVEVTGERKKHPVKKTSRRSCRLVSGDQCMVVIVRRTLTFKADLPSLERGEPPLARHGITFRKSGEDDCPRSTRLRALDFWILLEPRTRHLVPLLTP